MEHIAALLLIVACSDNACREMPAPASVFESVAECEAERRPAVGAYTTKYPQVFATCLELDPALEEDYAEIVWDIGSDGTLHASIETADDVMVASSGDRREKDYLSQE